MCEIVVMLNSVVNPAYKNGDIMEVRDDGWNWGTNEIGNPNWVIVKIPGAASSDYVHTCAAGMSKDVSGNVTIHAPCSHQMSLTAINALTKTNNSVTMTSPAALAAISLKASTFAQMIG